MRQLAFVVVFTLLVMQFQNCTQNEPFEVSASSVNEVFGVRVGAGNIQANPKAFGRTIIIEDEGFEFTHEIFKNKIIQKYEIACESDSTVIYDLDLSLTKSEILNRLQAPRNEGCNIVPVSDFPKPQNTFFNPENVAAWNQAVLKKSIGSIRFIDEFESYFESFVTEDGKNSLTKGGPGHHATFVSGLVAFNNPSVKIIALDKNMNTFNRHEGLTAFGGSDCDQIMANYDTMINHLTDPDIKNAFINQPAGDRELALLNIYKDNNVTLHNKSFSVLSSAYKVADFIIRLQCFGGATNNSYVINTNLDSYENALALSMIKDSWSSAAKEALAKVKAFTLAKAEVDHERYKRIYSEVLNQVVQIRAAGNDMQNISNVGDIDVCYPLPNEIIVGSIDYRGNTSDYTNFGNCVDFYMLGEMTISTLPLGVLYATSGTSFSAPLTARLMSLTIDPKLSFEQKKAKLISYGDSAGIVAKPYMITALPYDNTSEALGKFAKTSSNINPQQFDFQDQQRQIRDTRLQMARELYGLNTIFGK